MGFPAATIDVPRFDPDLATLVARARHDPCGDVARLVGLLEGRSGPPAGHLAATAWVLDRAARHVLLVRHRLLGWACPGGHLEPGESLIDAAHRELGEETGLDAVPAFAEPFTVRVVEFPDGPSGPAHLHWIVGIGFVGDPAQPLVPEPGAPTAWFPVDALPTPRVPDLDDDLPALVRLLRR